MRTIIAVMLLMTNVALGGFEQTELSPRAKALGGAYVGLADDVWAIFFNVAGLSTLNTQELSFLYIPGQFGLKELSSTAGAIGFPTGIGTFGLSGRKYGFELYREFTGTISYANTIEMVGIGINLNYHSVSIQHYGSAGTIGIDVGVLIPIFDQMRIGIAAKNINAPTIGNSKEKLPQAFSSGVMYRPVDNMSIVLDYRKELGFDPSSRVGIEYWIIDALALRGGMSDEPAQYSGGVGIRFSLFQFDYAYLTHQDLGATHIGSITIRWGGSHE